MNPMPELAPMLKQLRLSGILDSLDSRNKQAIDKKMAYTEFLALLIADEVARRDQKRFTTRLRRASFRSHKTLDQFDFDFNPLINSALIHDLITGQFIEENQESYRPGHRSRCRASGARRIIYFAVTAVGKSPCRSRDRVLRAQVPKPGARIATDHRRLWTQTVAPSPR